MTIAQKSVTVSANDWEKIKSTFATLSNWCDCEGEISLFEMCEEAIRRMEKMQYESDRHET